MNQCSMDDLVKLFMDQVRIEDLINVGFMKPVQCALRTNHVDKEVPANTLPQGLMIAHKQNGINDNKYSLHRLKQANQQGSLQNLRKQHQDNYLSLLKKKQGTQLAICVCMYSEDKRMLKRTLQGIADNIDLMIEKGTSPDDIFVAIVIDGIQKVDSSLFDYFQQLQRQSQIFLEEDGQNTLRKKYQQERVNTEVDQKPPLNYSRFLFQPQEFQDRIDRQFLKVRQKYDDVVKLRTQIQNIKKQRSSAANNNLKMILNKIIDQQKSALQAMNQQGIDQAQMDITEQSIMKQLGAAQEQCNQYISSRDNLAYISSYRLPTKSLSSTINQQEQKAEQLRVRSHSSASEIRQNLINGEQTSRQGMEEQAEVVPVRRRVKYVNLYFCIKYKNSGKLSSHNWFFNGICKQLAPRYAILLDVGLRPYPESLYKMYKYMKIRPHIGGVCGYMSLKAQKVEDDEGVNEEQIDWLSSIAINIFDIQRAQQIQYHFAHLIDKPFQSIFKFIHVLPGAFSGYSMDALRPKDRQDALLKQYFKSIDEKLQNNKVVPNTYTPGCIIMRVLLPKFIWKIFYPVDPDSEQQVLYNENIYLAEDRILCMGIHKNEKDIIFMPDAYAEVDPIKTVNGLMGQRKRWINGSMFAFEKVQKQMKNSSSEKMAVADFFLKMQIFYLNMSNFLVYFAPALLLFTFHLTMQTIQQDYLINVFAIKNPNGIGSIIYATFVNFMDFLYALMFLAIIFFSVHLTHGNKTYIYFIYFFSTMFGLFSLLTFIIFFVDVIKGFAGVNSYIKQQYQAKLDAQMPGVGGLIDLLRYFIISSMALYIFPIALYGIFFLRLKYLWQILSGTLSFLFYSPTYLNLLNVYALCRIDDISWGTKGLDASVGGKNAKLKQTWKIVKMIDVAKFFFWNIIVGVGLVVVDSFIIVKFFITLSLLVIFTFIQAIKMFIGVAYMIKYKCITAKKNHVDYQPENYYEQPVQKPLAAKQMKMHIYQVIDRFGQKLMQQIQFSFQMAAQQKNQQLIQQQLAQNAQNTEIKNNNNDLKPQNIFRPQTKLQPRSSRISKNVMMAFQANRFQNIRKQNQGKRDFYPDQKRKSKNIGGDDEAKNIEFHLLQRKFDQQVKKQAPTETGRMASKRIDSIRNTFMMQIQSRRFQ